MHNIMDLIYGPLGKEYCMYFYYLSIIGFVFMFIILITLIISIIKSKKVDQAVAMQSFTVALVYFIFYFQNRLLYSVCSNSMK